MTVTAREQRHARRATWTGVAAALAIVLLGLGVWAYVSTRPETAAVSRRDIVASVPLSGQVVAPPMARVDVSAPYRAPVARVYASVGDRVRRGDTLVELSFPSAQMAYEQARQAVKAAETAYANAQRQYRAPVEAAQKRLAQARAAERAARQGATAPADEAGTSGASGSSTSPPATGAAPAATEGGVTIREPAADLQQATQARQTAEQELAQAQDEMTAALTPYQRELEAAREQFQEAQHGRKAALIRAPISGTVLALNAQPGQEIGADRKTPVATIVDLTALEVQASMKAEQSSAVKPGLAATMTFEEVPNQSFEGRVSRITSRPSGPLSGQQYVAILDFKNEHGLVKPDMKARVAIRTGEARGALAVPSDAVDNDSSGRPVVKVLRRGTWQQVVVEPGLSDGHYTEIKSGLDAGETVRVTPSLL
jgi:HlyD family secretion protein